MKNMKMETQLLHVQQGTEVKTKETQSTDDSERLYSKRKTSSDIAVWALNIHS